MELKEKNHWKWCKADRLAERAGSLYRNTPFLNVYFSLVKKELNNIKYLKMKGVVQ
jgi:hypothetical protein